MSLDKSGFPDYLAEAIRRHVAEQIYEKFGLSVDGKEYCPHHKVWWDEMQYEPTDECETCGRARSVHYKQLTPVEDRDDS